MSLLDKVYSMTHKDCQIFIIFTIFLSCTIESRRYWRGEEEMAQELTSPENEIFEIDRPLFVFEDQNTSHMKRSGSGNIRLLRKKSNEPKVGIRLLQI